MPWVFAGCLLALLASPPAKTSEPVVLTGKVVPLLTLLKSRGLKFDHETIAEQVVLVQADGEAIPLLSDDASRALFKDDRLRNRRAEITGRRIAGLPYLQVLTFRIEENGQLQTPEYYCDVCSIRVRYPQICPCCQGEMYLRMQPDRP